MYRFLITTCWLLIWATTIQQRTLLTFTEDFDAFKTQQIAQHLNFSFQFADKFGVRIFIDNRFTDDLLRTIRVPNNYTIDRLFSIARLKNRWC